MLCKPEDLGLNSQYPCKYPGMAVHACNHGIKGRDGWMLGAPCAASLAEMDSKSPQLEKCGSSVWEPRVWLEVFIHTSEC